MFSKGFFVFGLLALFACQGATALTHQEIETIVHNEVDKLSLSATRASLAELIDQVKEAIANLNKLVTGVIGDALGTLGNLVKTIVELKAKFLTEGIAAITGGIGDALNFIKNMTEVAADLGIDISKCITGRDKQLQDLASGLTANLTDCVTTTISSALTMVNNDIKIINQIVGNVTNIPVKLSKCLINLRPITCVTNLLGDVTTMLKNLPGQIVAIVNEATQLVEDLPTQLAGCVTNIASSTTSQTQDIIVDIGTCVGNIIDGNSTQAPTDPSIAASRASLDELVEQVKEATARLNELVPGDALRTLDNLVNTVSAYRDKFLSEGMHAITRGIINSVLFLDNITEVATELGIDITKCIDGRVEQLGQLDSELTNNLIDCMTAPVENAFTMVYDDILIVELLVINITSIPIQLSDCMTSLNPITCVTNLLGDVTTLLKTLPGQITGIVNEATKLVDNLPTQLPECVSNAASSTTSKTEAFIVDIGTCVGNIIDVKSTVARF